MNSLESKAKVEDGVAWQVLGDTLVTVWKAPVTLQNWQRLMGEARTLASEFPKGILLFELVLSESDPPNAKLRSKMQADLREFGVRLRRLVVVPVGSSVWLSVVRAIARSILLLSGLSKQHAVTATVEEGLTRIREVAGASTPSREGLQAVVKALCSALTDEGVALAS